VLSYTEYITAIIIATKIGSTITLIWKSSFLFFFFFFIRFPLLLHCKRPLTYSIDYTTKPAYCQSSVHRRKHLPCHGANTGAYPPYRLNVSSLPQLSVRVHLVELLFVPVHTLVRRAHSISYVAAAASKAVPDRKAHRISVFRSFFQQRSNTDPQSSGFSADIFRIANLV
jgi:hypothetical protein